MSKTTFYQIFKCISLKVLNTGSLQIFANPCKFASQLCPKMPFHFFGKMSLPQTVYFPISNFWYKLTQPTVRSPLRMPLALRTPAYCAPGHNGENSESYQYHLAETNHTFLWNLYVVLLLYDLKIVFGIEKLPYLLTRLG